MDFLTVIKTLVGGLDAAGVRYALIGGFAMALRGLQRTTADLDFILALEDMEKADTLLRGLGYARLGGYPPDAGGGGRKSGLR